jgi:dimethylamine corrinoid protein
MCIARDELYRQLSDAVVEMEEERATSLAEDAIRKGFDAFDAIAGGLVPGMTRAGELFEEEEYFIPELLLCSDAMYAGLDVLKPHLKVEQVKEKDRVVIGVVEGDTHDIGKNLVKIMLETSGFDVLDLGRDVPPRRFVDEAISARARIIALSTLMTTTMEGMADVVRYLGEKETSGRP